MSYDFDRIYSEFGSSGIAPFLTGIENLHTYKLVTGVASIDPYRPSAAGRAYGDDFYHIYTADRIDVCSGEVLGTSPVPPKSLIGDYTLSGVFLDYDRVTVPGFQEPWRSCSGEQRHDFSQEFTRYLAERGVIPSGAIGSVWTSISGEALGIGGRCYGITASGAPHVIYNGSYEYPQ
jgi:hypothetical protein